MAEQMRSERIKGRWRRHSLSGLRQMSGRAGQHCLLFELSFLGQNVQLPRQQGYFMHKARCYCQSYPIRANLRNYIFSRCFKVAYKGLLFLLKKQLVSTLLIDQQRRCAECNVDAHTGVTGASPEDWLPFFVRLSISAGSSTANLLPNRDELVGIVQGRGRCRRGNKGRDTASVAYRHQCNWLHSSQRVAAPYSTV